MSVLEPQQLLRQLGESARLEACPGNELEAVLQQASRDRISALERHLADCRDCGALVATAMRSTPALDQPASPACSAVVRQALSRPARSPRPRRALVWSLAALGLIAAGSGLPGLLLAAGARSVHSAGPLGSTPLRLAPEDPPGGDALRSGPAEPRSNPALERAEWLLGAARLLGAEPSAVALLQARIALLRGQPNRALTLLRRPPPGQSQDPRIEAVRAAALLQLGRRAQARAAARRQSELTHQSAWALYNLALLSEPEDGAELFTRALQRERNPHWRRRIEQVQAALAP